MIMIIVKRSSKIGYKKMVTIVTDVVVVCGNNRRDIDPSSNQSIMMMVGMKKKPLNTRASPHKHTQRDRG